MNSVQEGKHFSITDPQGIKTVIYQVYKKRIFKRISKIYSRET